MGRPKKNADVEEVKEEKEELNYSDALVKKYSDVIKSGRSVVDKPRKVISISPSIDIQCGGGVPEGMVMILTGKPKIGKTTTALQVAANAQQLDGRPVYYISIEGRLKARDLTGIHNLDVDKVTVISSEQGQILSGEEFLEIAEIIINTVPNAVVIIDSFSALCTSKERIAEYGDALMGATQRVMARFIRKVNNVIPVNNTLVIGITHVAANLGYGSAWVENVGMKVNYQHDLKLWGKTVEPWKINKDGQQVGQSIAWDIVTSPISGTGSKATSWLRYGHGLDKEMELANIATDLGIITKAGAWYKIALFDDQQFQGIEKVRGVLVDNPKYYDKLKEEIYTIMGIK